MRHISSFLLLSIIPLFLSLSINAQISSGGIPYSKQFPDQLSQPIATIKLPKVNASPLLAEDELLTHKGTGYRFATPIPLALSLSNSGIWETLPNGDRIWRIQIYSAGAKNMYLEYDRFYLPKGSKLHLYNPDQSVLLGAFTSSNNKASQKFVTGIIAGETSILEYYEPKSVSGQGIIEISRAFHGYRTFQDVAKDFGDSGACNNNVNCPEWSDWEDQIKAVVLIIAGGRRACTGTMLNNTRTDCTPYLLTANHCNLGDVAQTLFIFNYESATCANVDVSLQQSIAGATVMANAQNADFELLLLSTPPPPDYDAFYAGWNRAETIAGSTVTIHHPRGDIKKISLNTQNPVSTPPTDDIPAQHWLISEWEDGTTEPSSSGAALFNEEGLVIGQLFGGAASCDSLTFDAFGRLDYSWNKGQQNNSRLRDWLDPANTAAITLNGRYCTNSQAQVDVALLSVVEPTAIKCNPQSFTPEVVVYNNGTTPIPELSFMVAGMTPHIWTGQLLAGETRSIVLDEMGIIEQAGNYDWTIRVATSEQQIDENLSNNELDYHFEVLDLNEISIELITDRFGNETTLTLTDEAGQTVAAAGPFNDSDTTVLTYCVGNGDYQFSIFDSATDGICCVFGNGSYQIIVNDSILIGQGGEFGAVETISFTINDTLVGFAPNAPSIPSEHSPVHLFPNPVQNELWINYEATTSAQTVLHIYNLQGQQLFQTNIVTGLQSIPFRKIVGSRNERAVGSVYIVVVQTPHHQQVHKILYLPD